MEPNLLDRMLNTYQADQTSVAVTLQNKIRVSGKILAFDSYIIVIDGPKRSVVYRHAVSCIAPQTPEKQKQTAAVPASPKMQPAATAAAAPTASQKPRHQPSPAPVSAPAAGSNLNNSMKEGLLKWMREQKAAK